MTSAAMATAAVICMGCYLAGPGCLGLAHFVNSAIRDMAKIYEKAMSGLRNMPTENVDTQKFVDKHHCVNDEKYKICIHHKAEEKVMVELGKK